MATPLRRAIRVIGALWVLLGVSAATHAAERVETVLPLPDGRMFILFEGNCLLGDDFTYFHGMTYARERSARELGCWKRLPDGQFEVRFGEGPAIMIPKGTDETLILEFPGGVPTFKDDEEQTAPRQTSAG